MIALQDIQFAPKKFLHGHHQNGLAADGNRVRPGEPRVVNPRSTVGHGPDDIDDHVRFNAAIDPSAIVTESFEVVRKSGLTECLNGSRSVLGQDVEINVLGIPPASSKRGQGEPPPQQKRYPGVLHRLDGQPINVPLFLRNGIGPTELQLRGIA